MRERIVGFLLIVAVVSTLAGSWYGLSRFISADIAGLVVLLSVPAGGILWNVSFHVGRDFMRMIGK